MLVQATGWCFSVSTLHPCSSGVIPGQVREMSYSSSDPGPGSDEYFTGGDNTRRHACGAEALALGGVTGGNICGVQIEANFTGVRDTPANRDRFADITAVVVGQYLAAHWSLTTGPNATVGATK